MYLKNIWKILRHNTSKATLGIFLVLLPYLSHPKELTTWRVDTMNLAKILMVEEGFSPAPYLCSEGYVTIGFGTKLQHLKGLKPEHFPIRVSISMAKEWMQSEVDIKDGKLRDPNINPFAHTYANMDDDRRAIILSMAYQMGTAGVLKFKKMWRALSIYDYVGAAYEALDSTWAISQSPNRAHRHADVLFGESMEEVYGGQ